jgi:hypothetical protein
MVRVDGHANAFRITVIFVLLLLSVILVMVRVDGHANPFRIQRRQPRFYATTTFLSPSADSEQQPSQSYCNVWSNAAIGLCPTQERNTRRPPREANVFFLTLETRGSSSFSFVPHFSTTDVGLFNRKHSNTSCGNFNHTNNFINSKHSVDWLRFQNQVCRRESCSLLSVLSDGSDANLETTRMTVVNTRASKTLWQNSRHFFDPVVDGNGYQHVVVRKRASDSRKIRRDEGTHVVGNFGLFCIHASLSYIIFF